MISTDLLRKSAFQCAGLLRARVPKRLCRFKTPNDSCDDWHSETWSLRAFRDDADGWVPYAKSDFTGRFICHLLTLDLPAKDLENVVSPHGLTLQPSGGTNHTVFLLFGRQQGVRQILWPNGVWMDYLESIIAIPQVRLRNCSDGYCGPFNFVTRIDANELSPVLLGRIIGYPKHLGWMESSSTRFTIAPVGTTTPILTAQFEPYGKRMRPRDLPAFQNEFAMMRDPVFSRSVLGQEIFTHLDWQLDEAWARVQQATASVTVHKDLPGLPAKTYQWGQNDSSGKVSVRLSVPWQLSGPFPRSIIRSVSPQLSAGQVGEADYRLR